MSINTHNKLRLHVEVCKVFKFQDILRTYKHPAPINYIYSTCIYLISTVKVVKYRKKIRQVVFNKILHY